MTDDLETGKKINNDSEQDPETFVAPETGRIDDAENPELELTPEIEEMVMEKVQDINRPGVCYHFTREINDVDNFLRFGLLALREQEFNGSDVSANTWLDSLRSSRQEGSKHVKEEINFNITGRSDDIAMLKFAFPEYRNKTDMYLSHYNFMTCAFIFNVSDLKEVTDQDYKYKQQIKHREYHTRDNPRKKGAIVDSETGFRTYPRIAPRFLKGIIANAPKTIEKDQWYDYCYKVKFCNFICRSIEDRNIKTMGMWPESIKELTTQMEEVISRIDLSEVKKESIEDLKSIQSSVDQTIWSGPRMPAEEGSEAYQNAASEIIQKQISVNSQKPKNLIPVYDIYGNLLWPRQMSYEEVKEFVAKRDSKGETKGIEDKGGNSKGGQKGETKGTSEEKDEPEGIDGDNAI